MAPKANVTQMKDKVKSMEEADRDKFLHEVRKNWLKGKSQIESKHSKYNSSRIQESWLKIMRSAKTKQLKREVEIIAQNHERDMDRKDAIMQMLDRDLDEAEEQHQVAIRTHLLNIDTLTELQKSRLEALEQDFLADVNKVESEWQQEKTELTEAAQKKVRELQHVINEVTNEERAKEQLDVTEHQSQYELIRNKNIETDHQMRSNLEERIESVKERCNNALNSYRLATEQNSSDYRTFLTRDATLSKHVERKLRQVERMQSSIQHWRIKILQNKQESGERNAHLRTEKEHLLKHFQELKNRMQRFRDEERKRLTELTVNGSNCLGKLKERLTLGESILKLGEQCRRFETEREKVLPFYQDTILTEKDVEALPLDKLLAEFQEARSDAKKEEKLKLQKQKMELFTGAGAGGASAMIGGESDDEYNEEEEYAKLREEIKEILDSDQRDEWSYLDSFFRRFNKVHLDVLAIQKEKQKLANENGQLRSILKQFLDGVAVNNEVLERPNPLFVVNGRVNLNYIPPRKEIATKVVVEAHQTVKNMALMR